MRSNNKKYFFEIDSVPISEKVILLDIDGTIASDDNEDVSLRDIEMIRLLEADNEVYLLSNNRNRERIRNVEGITGLQHLSTQSKKPSKKILEASELKGQKKILVIGDKYLTDVLFARRIGAEYIKVKRLSEETDRFFVKLTFLVDDLVYSIWNCIF